jgi:small subunit ribosomal protein S16
MVAIRLARGGTKKRPFYHIIVTDSRNRRDGRYIERIGFLNPIATDREESLRLDQGRLKYWLGVGAQPSERVQQLMKQQSENAPIPTTDSSAVTETVAVDEATVPTEQTIPV